MLVLPDLGSAVLTARTVLDDRAEPASRAGPADGGEPADRGEPADQDRPADRGAPAGPGALLVDAPFVEGAVAAAVIAATGADLATVSAAAVEARDANKF